MYLGLPNLGLSSLSRVFTPPYVPTNTEVSDWATRVASNGGSASNATLLAMDVFVTDCKTAVIWTKMTRLNLVCGNQLAAAQVPLVVGGGSATETLVNITGSDYVETGSSGGIKGNGVDKYFNTGWNPVTQTASLTDFGLWAYVKGIEAGGTSRSIIGAQATSSSYCALGWMIAGTAEIGVIGGISSTDFTPTGTPAGKESFLGITVAGDRLQQYYQNGATVGASRIATGAYTSQSLFGLASNINGAAANFSTRNLRAYAITTGFTGADATAFNTALQTFQTALSRNV